PAATLSSAPTVNRVFWTIPRRSRTFGSDCAAIATPIEAFSSSTSPIASTRGCALLARFPPIRVVSPLSPVLVYIRAISHRQPHQGGLRPLLRERVRVEDVREDLDAVHEARAGAAEVARGVHREHRVLADRGKVPPSREAGEDLRICDRAVHVEPARHEDDDLRGR